MSKYSVELVYGVGITVEGIEAASIKEAKEIAVDICERGLSADIMIHHDDNCSCAVTHCVELGQISFACEE